MLIKTLIFLYLGVELCFSSDVGESKACGDYALGPPQQLILEVGKLLDISWKPPLFYENCLVEYKLHIQNMNTSEYLTPVQSLTGLNYSFDYGFYDHICIHVRVTVHSAYNGMAGSFASQTTYLDSLLPFSAPNALNFVNNKDHLMIEWTKPIGFEKCTYAFMFYLEAYMQADGRTIGRSITNGRQYSISYTDDNQSLYCKVAVVNVRAQYWSHPPLYIEKSLIFGPPGYCSNVE